MKECAAEAGMEAPRGRLGTDDGRTADMARRAGLGAWRSGSSPPVLAGARRCALPGAERAGSDRVTRRPRRPPRPCSART